MTQKKPSKKWGLLYIPTGTMLYKRTLHNNRHNFDVYVDKKLAGISGSILYITQKSKPKTSTFINKINTRLSKRSCLTLLYMVSMDFPHDKNGNRITLYEEEFEIVEVSDDWKT